MCHSFWLRMLQSQYGNVTRESILRNRFSNCNKYQRCHGKNCFSTCTWCAMRKLNSKLRLQSNRMFSCEQHCNIVPQYCNFDRQIALSNWIGASLFLIVQITQSYLPIKMAILWDNIAMLLDRKRTSGLTVKLVHRKGEQHC